MRTYRAALGRSFRIALVNITIATVIVSVASADDLEGESTDGAVAATASTADGADASSSWSLEKINRPLTLPKGAFSAGLGVSAYDLGDEELRNVDVTITGLRGLSYGVTDELTVGLSYTGLAATTRGPLDLNAAYTHYAGDALTLAATASAGYNMLSEGVTPIMLGEHVRYNVTDSVTVGTPGAQLGIDLRTDNVVFATLPVSVGLQVNRHVFATVETNVAPSIVLSGPEYAESVMFGADVIPMGLTAWYSPSNAIDIGVSVRADLKNQPANNIGIGLSLLYYGGV